MNPSMLIAPSSPIGLPAPFWFLILFKLIGFTLHMTMMHLWYAGPVLGLILWTRGGNHQIFVKRLMAQMPIIIALGINFGIVPLLFIQVAYHKAFYPSTILMAWPWMSVILLLTFAYYGSYIYATALKADTVRLTPLSRIAGWVSAVFFLIIGFIFANEFSLMTNLDAWSRIWSAGHVDGAVPGLALNISDPTFWPRWLLMFGMALMTVSAYIAIDCGFLGRKMDADYRKWATGFAYKPYLVGLAWYGVAAAWYMFGAWPNDLRTLIFAGSWLPLTILTAIAPVAVAAILTAASRKETVSPRLAFVVGMTQLLVLAFNAVNRQVVQNAELGRYFDVTAEQVKTQWSPMILFLVLFVIGVGIIIWMLRQLTVSKQEQAA
ncbi:MAG: hypothetical protein A2W25_17085 [candidate division Zixibacteria bacterium RBG_16_53_22]|nr:MAG: hypothetical protein A2W25_17085 [candidate division Zixibacteria bacterium RBG_16_53_22]